MRSRDVIKVARGSRSSTAIQDADLSWLSVRIGSSVVAWNEVPIIFQAIAIVYAIMTTRSLHLNWKMRALRVLPMFLLPALSSLIYFALRSVTRMFDRKDHKTLEKLRAERQAKINELKEKTNYYTTQQLIQRYDTDPAAKAAAAAVLALKLGADSGLKVYVGDESEHNAPIGKSNDVEITNETQNTSTRHPEGVLNHVGSEGAEMSQQHQIVVEHHQPQAGLSAHDGGWIARLAALLVGEDPTQSYALICGNCHMHNGLARKEDFPYVTYYCPHCHALNRQKQQHDERVSGLNSPTMSSSTVEEADAVPSAVGPVVDTTSASNSPVTAAAATISEN
ncbi:putative membrane protein [Handroanthus impetiginosus]|uniref:Putative membrane protein n=1 Tax=Handroanthus impetiginosus TaxID=429701 RepID=A0A2G9GL39_9LAMI|nr:putative membrane protein [Handroanthus impetiginosus]